MSHTPSIPRRMDRPCFGPLHAQRGAVRRVALGVLPFVLASARAEAQPVDLLHAVDSAVAVSSVYRNQGEQAEWLVDDSLDTAWNSRSGDLSTAWVELRVPTSAHVTNLEITVGFTRTLGTTDLFVGNHRVRRVRVFREGSLLREHTLDIEQRALQRIPIDAPGGGFRIEIAETVPGSRRDWREVCISELRVMGHDPNARPGARVPRVAVGVLPAPVDPAPPDRVQLARVHPLRVSDFERRWLSIERIASSSRVDSAPDASWPQQSRELLRTRRAVLTSLADFVAAVDTIEADAIRMRARRRMDDHWSSSSREAELTTDLTTLAHAMDAVHRVLDDPGARCRWARAMARVSLRRATAWVQSEDIFANMAASQNLESGALVSRSEDARLRRVGALREALETAEHAWGGNVRGVVQRLLRLSVPQGTRGAFGFDALRTWLEACREACGWR